jgi:hypothetical protein
MSAPSEIRGMGFNVFPALMGLGFPLRSLTFQADTENVLSCVDIPIMGRPAVAALPMPYAKRAHTFRTAGGDCPAARTRLGSVSFAGFHKYRLPTGRFVREHLAERGPTSIENGFRHPRLCQARRVHIADDDQTVLVDQLCAGDVQKVLPSICDLGVYGPDAFLVTGSLGTGEGRLLPAIEFGRGDLVTIAHGGEFFQAKVNSHRTCATRDIISDFANEGDIPAAASILDERSSFERAINIAGFPEPKAALEVDGGVAVDPDGPVNEWNPPERSARAKARTEARAFLMQVTAGNKLLADAHNGIGVEPELGAVACAQLDQVERCGPLDLSTAHPSPVSVLLVANEEVPDLVTGNGMPVEMLPDSRILDAEFVSDKAQLGLILVPSGSIKSAPSTLQGPARSSFIVLPAKHVNPQPDAGRAALEEQP